MAKPRRYLLIALRFLLALFMMNAGLQHFLKPAFYVPFVPSFLPYTDAVILLSGIVEVALGVLLLLPKKASMYGALGTLLLMLAFLPVHIADLFAASPAIGSHRAAWIRLFLQCVFIAWVGMVYRQQNALTDT